MTLRKGPVPPENRPIAFLSDVPGNLPALEAVLAELERREVGSIIVAGDHLLGGDAPLETFRRLTQVGARMVRGLSDTALASVDPAKLRPTTDVEKEKAEAFKRTREALGDLVLEQLRRLPDRIRLPLIDGREVLIVHGSPLDPTREVTFDMPDEEVSMLMDDDPADIVVCGASHIPFRIELDDRIVLGLGAVGAYTEERVAHFTVLSPAMGETHILQDFVTY
jgi:predicted phosphodiesterase